MGLQQNGVPNSQARRTAMTIQRYFALGLAWLSLTPCAFTQPPGQDANALAAFQNALKQDGFDVTSGAAVAWDPAAAYCANQTNSALYFNKEPYLLALVPQPGQPPSPQSGEFQLGSEEAVVIVGLTPPPAKYFSYTPYLDWKVYPDRKTRVLATLGDAVNNATVRTTGPAPFNAPVVLIFTPDQKTDTRVRAALQRAGYPAAIINTVVLPASMLSLGYGENADQVLIGLRNAIWQDPVAGAGYVRNPPLSVFRVTPRVPAMANPFPAPGLRVRGTGQTEMQLMNKLGQLREGIAARNPGLYATDIPVMPMCYEGYDLIQRGFPMCGDSRDAFYIGAGIPEYDSIKITLENDEFLMLYGVNHVATRKATYMNTNVYASETAKLTLGAVDDSKFSGTASGYLPAGDPEANLMYAYKVSPSCGRESNCLQLSVAQNCTRLTIDSSTLLGIFTRMYLEPATKVGPAMPEILYDRVLKFSPRPAQQ
jgi:hypothetical protein